MKARITIIVLSIAAVSTVSGSAFARDHLLVNNAVASVVGLQNLEYDYKVSDSVAIGVIGVHASRAKQNGIDLDGNSIGGVARFYWGRAFEQDAWFASFAANRSSFEASVVSNGTLYHGKSGNSISMGAGYHWFWDSFNLSAGISLSNKAKFSLKDAAGHTYRDEMNTIPCLEIKMGGSF